MAWSVTTLAWGVIEFKDAYVDSGEYSNVLNSLKWVTDYFIKAHPSKYEFYGQVRLQRYEQAWFCDCSCCLCRRFNLGWRRQRRSFVLGPTGANVDETAELQNQSQQSRFRSGGWDCCCHGRLLGHLPWDRQLLRRSASTTREGPLWVCRSIQASFGRFRF